MQDFFFTERGIAYRVNEFQPGRCTLVFIHGLSGSSSAWLPYEERFQTTHNLLTLDLRGHGKSDKPKRYAEYELKRSAEDIYELLTYLHIEQFSLISHSYGTLVALEFLIAHPEKVSKVIFLSPNAYLNHTRWFVLVKIFGSIVVRLCEILPYYSSKRGRVDYSSYKNTGDWNVRRLISDLRITTIRVYFFCLLQSYSKDYENAWRALTLPVLIVHGKKDSVIPAKQAIRLAQEIPGAQLVLLEEANHIVVLTDIDETIEHIRSFS